MRNSTRARQAGLLLALLGLWGCDATTDLVGVQTLSAGGGDGGLDAGPTDAGTPADGGRTDSGSGGCVVSVPQTVRLTRGEVDILIGIDGTSDMEVQASKVETGLQQFGFDLLDSSIDARLMIVSEGPPEDTVCIRAPLGNGDCTEDDSAPPRYVHALDFSVTSSVLLSMVRDSDTYEVYEPWLRATAGAHLVVISSDDGVPSVSPETWDERIVERDERFRGYVFHSIVPQPGSDCGPSDDLYPTLAMRTGGTQNDICPDDLGPAFDNLLAAIESAAETCAWDIPPVLSGPEFQVGQVNVEIDGSGGRVPVGQVPLRADCARAQGGQGWYYDNPAAPTTMLACPETCQDLRSTTGLVHVGFGCQTIPADFIQ